MISKRLNAAALLVAAASLAGCDSKIRDAEDVVRRNMLDPDSAQFREVYRVNDVVCGQVNAKNAYGAYVGYKRFYVDELGAVYPDTIDTEVLVKEALYRKYCWSN